MKQSTITLFVLLCVMIHVEGLKAQTFTTLGIGTSPVGTLHVHSAVQLDSEEPILPMSVPMTGDYETIIHVTNTNTGKTVQDGFSIVQNNGKITLRQFEQNNFNLFGYNQQGISITPSGDVGVGTIAPAERLHVIGNAFVTKSLFADTSVVSQNVHSKSTFVMGVDNQVITMGKAHYESLNYSSSYIGFNASRNPGEQGTWSFRSNTWQNGGVVVFSTMSGDLLIANMASGSVVNGNADCTNVTDELIMEKVNFKLASDGVLFTRGVKVSMDENDWPDYVFEKGYHLVSLEETEVYVKENGHLPGVPSAKEVAEEGVDLGEMNKILLRKIEELTLQVIELSKQVKELKGECAL